MDDSKRAELLDVIDRYAQHLEAAGQLEQADSIAAGQAAAELYADPDWVAEWLEQKPAPKRPSNRWQEDSFSRFTQWSIWKAQQTGRRSVTGRRQYQLRKAVVTIDHLAAQIPNLNPVQIRNEKMLRPLTWMDREGYEHRKGEVWAIAVEDAGSVDAITEKVMRAAVNEWKRRNLSTGTGKAPRTAKAEHLRIKAYSSIHELIELARRDPAAKEQLDLLWKQAKLDMESGRWVSGAEAA